MAVKVWVNDKKFEYEMDTIIPPSNGRDYWCFQFKSENGIYHTQYVNVDAIERVDIEGVERPDDSKLSVSDMWNSD